MGTILLVASYWLAAALAILAGPAWDGSPRVLTPRQTAILAQTPNGSTILTYENQATSNNDGSLAVQVGGAPPQTFDVPALRRQPSFLVRNFAGASLIVANTSIADATPVLVADVGPGLPGTKPQTLPTDGTLLSLPPGATAQATTIATYMDLVVRNLAGNRSDVVVIGGPPDAAGNNAYGLAVNAPQATGPPSSMPAVPPYYATTTATTYEYELTWPSATVFVANLSGETAGPVQLALFVI